jgi:hypothetical protein
VLQSLEHGGHLAADIAALAPVNQSGNAAHFVYLPN